MRTASTIGLVGLLLVVMSVPVTAADAPPGEGWAALFNGKDLTGWKLPSKGEGHWRAVDGLIDYDARGGGVLWTEKAFGDFILQIDWRLKTVEELYGSDKDEDGKPYPYSPDSGIYLRGVAKAQTNIWANPMGSGEVWGYRVDEKLPEEIRKACTPKLRADKPVGEWNRQVITMKGDRLTVVLNGKTVIDNAQLPEVPESGPVGLQHHGGFDEKTGRWLPGSACIQFRNIYIKELPSAEK